MTNRARMTLCLAVTLVTSLSYLAAAEPKVELLWPDGAPGPRATPRGISRH